MDRIEGKIAVVLRDDDRSYDVPRAQLPKKAREGSVLRVASVAGAPDWSTAVIEEAEERRRDREAQETLDRLKKTDPGGDVQL